MGTHLKTFTFTAALTCIVLLLPLAARADDYVFTHDIQLYDYGPDVHHLQQFLNSKGFAIATSGPGSLGNETSTFGLRTFVALAAYQRSVNLPPTGYFGSLTRATISNSSTTPEATPLVTAPAAAPSRDLSLGSSGVDVIALQKFLNTHGYVIAEKGPGSPGNETQYFGPATLQALTAYQLANSLPGTGYFGALTRTAVLATGEAANAQGIAQSSQGATASTSSLAAPATSSTTPGSATSTPESIQAPPPFLGVFAGGGTGGTPTPAGPTAILSAPANNAVISGAAVSLTATFAASALNVTFAIDGTNIASTSTSSPYAMTWDSRTVSDGAHTISAVASDGSGNSATSSVTVTVDNHAPIIGLALAGKPTASSVTITWNSDKPATSQVLYDTIAYPYGFQTATDTTLTTAHSVTLSGLAQNTSYHYQVRSASVGGNLTVSNDQVFATPTQSSALPGTSIDLDFVNQRYSGSDPGSSLSLSRATPETCLWADGHVSYAAANQLCITDLGLAVFQASSNDLLWNRDLTNVAWIVSGATVAKDQTGVDGVASAASSMVATTTNATVMQSITLASSSRFQSAYVKRLAGTGEIDMTMNNGATWVPITASTTLAGYSRISIPTQTIANPKVGFRITTAGDEIAIDMVQNEPGLFATPPIPTTSATSTRAGDVILPTGPLTTLLVSGSFSVYAKIPTSASINGGLLSSSGVILGTHTCGPLSMFTGQYGWTGVVGNDCHMNKPAQTRGTGPDGVAIGGFSALGRSLSWNNGPIVSDSDSFNYYAYSPSEFRIGGQTNGSGTETISLNTYLQRLAIWNSRLTDTQLQQLGQTVQTSPNLSAGYSRLAFNDDFNATTTVDMSVTGNSGYNWYPQGYFGGASTASTSINIANSVLTLSGVIGTAFPTSTAPYYTGTAFGNGAYFEARIAFDPALGANASGWPAFWSLSVEHLYGVSSGLLSPDELYPGQSGNYVHFSEPDFFEAWHNPNQSYVGKTNYLATDHDWSGTYVNGAWQYNIANTGTNAFYPYQNTQAIDWNQFHTYGTLWVPQSGDTPGYIQWFFDGIPGSKVYWKGLVGAPPLAGQSTGTYSPSDPSQATSTYSIIDSQHPVVILSTDKSWPMKVDWVRVWQK